MSSATGPRLHGNFSKGFTLVEMLIVLALLAIVMSVVYASLKGFFRGRNLDNEARRFLSVTRYAQERAIAEGVPMDLWIDPLAGAYGVRAEDGYTEKNGRENTFALDDTVQIMASAPPTTMLRSNYWTQANSKVAAGLRIRFQPDGFISDNSPENIFLKQGRDGQIWIAETTNHLRYDIQTGQPAQ